MPKEEIPVQDSSDIDGDENPDIAEDSSFDVAADTSKYTLPGMLKKIMDTVGGSISDFSLSSKQAELLRPDFERKLKAWEVFAGSIATDKKLEDYFVKNHGAKITSESYAEFKKLCRRNCNYSDSLPFEICNPDSGWFYVLKHNDIEKWGEFYNALHAEFHDWFML